MTISPEARSDQGASLVTERRVFRGAGLDLVGDVAGDPGGQPLLFLHGGGQTRASWKRAVVAAAERGYFAVSLDLRGHGESGWSQDGIYSLTSFADDIRHVMRALPAPPVLVGASLGGVASLLVTGNGADPAVAALVLVDMVPKLEKEGSSAIGAFMRSAPEGFASLEEATDAVAAYLPHRVRPADSKGLMRNLRLKADGRYYWHWDPAFMNLGAHPDMERRQAMLEDAGRLTTVPVLVLRGALSRVVSEGSARAFAAELQDGEFVNVAGADHMVAGDRNDRFNAALFGFLDRRIRARA